MKISVIDHYDCTLKNAEVVLNQFWVKYGQTQPLGYIF